MTVNDIVSISLGCLFLIVVIGLCFFALYYEFKRYQLQNDYIKNLSDKEKSIILEYEKLQPKLFERNNKK